MRIGIYTDTFGHNPNGVSTSIYSLKRELELLGHEIWVICPSGGVEFVDVDQVERLKSLPYPPFPAQRVSLPSFGPVLPRFDVIHTHTPFGAGLLGLRTGKRLEIPIVTTIHVDYAAYLRYIPGFPTLQSRVDILRPLLRRLLNRASLVVVPSRYIEKQIGEVGTTTQVEVIPNGVDSTVMDDAQQDTHYWPDGMKRLLLVGRLTPEKNIALALQALSRISDAHLVIVGDGPLRHSLHRSACDLGVSDRLTLVGSVSFHEIGALYRGADVLLSTSQCEAQGMAVWEAQAVGTPVVASGRGATSEAVLDGVTGVLTKRDDAESFQSALNWLFGSHSRLIKLGENAKGWAAKNSARASAERLVRTYEELIAC